MIELGDMRALEGAASPGEGSGPFDGARWFVLGSDAAGVVFVCNDAGVPNDARYLWFDALLGGTLFVTFALAVRAGDQVLWDQHFSVLHQCQTRVVLDIPETIDLSAMDRMTMTVLRKRPGEAHLAVGPVRLDAQRPPVLATPALPAGPLVDELGQSRVHAWSTRTAAPADMVARLRASNESSGTARWPGDYSRWGGWAGQCVEATGFFHTHHDGTRWWLVDPDGYLFWSSGVDCLHPSIDHETRVRTRDMDLSSALTWLPDEQGRFAAAYGRNPWHRADDWEFNFVAANFIRAFGADHWYERWCAMAIAESRRIGFNTAGDWSDERAASRARFPYTRPLELGWRAAKTPMCVGGVPDVFHPAFEQDLAAFAEPLRETADDPAMIGYFLLNEPGWHFGDGFVSPAEEMLRGRVRSETRRALAAYLRERYGTDAGLAEAWGCRIDFDVVAGEAWMEPFSEVARRDLQAFSTILLRRICDGMTRACRRVDANHLNLGVRWWTFPPSWALAAMGGFDVISFNYYLPTVGRVHYGRDDEEAGIAELCEQLDKPMLVGEWHFGSLDAGLASAGLMGVANEGGRGKAFRVYLEQAAALPWCVGAHWFNFYDRPVLYSSGSNENYHIGLLDITHRRHEELCRAARVSHERLYEIAAGRQSPYDTRVRYIIPSR